MVKEYPLVFAENYYISYRGFVYFMTKKNMVVPSIKKGKLVVEINGKDYDLLNLMLEYFARHKVGYRRVIIGKSKKYPLHIPINTLTFIYDYIETPPDASDELLMSKYNCEKKAKMSNYRTYDSITKKDVLDCIKNHGFRCRYCGVEIHHRKWHLDHIKPIALNGKNCRDNIAPACKYCNLMKGALSEDEFIVKCKKIALYKK